MFAPTPTLAEPIFGSRKFHTAPFYKLWPWVEMCPIKWTKVMFKYPRGEHLLYTAYGQPAHRMAYKMFSYLRWLSFDGQKAVVGSMQAIQICCDFKSTSSLYRVKKKLEDEGMIIRLFMTNRKSIWLMSHGLWEEAKEKEYTLEEAYGTRKV